MHRGSYRETKSWLSFHKQSIAARYSLKRCRAHSQTKCRQAVTISRLLKQPGIAGLQFYSFTAPAPLGSKTISQRSSKHLEIFWEPHSHNPFRALIRCYQEVKERTGRRPILLFTLKFPLPGSLEL